MLFCNQCYQKKGLTSQILKHIHRCKSFCLKLSEESNVTTIWYRLLPSSRATSIHIVSKHSYLIFSYLSEIAAELGHNAKSMTITDLTKLLQSLDLSRRLLISQVIQLAKFLLVAPATNAVSKRSFSALKRLKTYMRSTMGDNRLNSLMVRHVHKDKTDATNLIDAANRFVGECASRKRFFGKFTDRDNTTVIEQKSVACQTSV